MSKEKISQVAIIMGSDSDLKIMKEAAAVLEEFEVPHTITVMSAHRTPDRSVAFAKSAAEKGIRVIIAGAGGAAHLAGVMAALTHLPVIGVPIQSKSLNGLDSLLSIVQMPAGIPVATVAIDGARNAGLLAVQMIALGDTTLSEKLVAYKKRLRSSVEEKAKELEEVGYKKYLKEHE
ncbi:MAG TPA: 5-(carboxyamino)imidazole ribonucleotide mutase [Chitinophagales bacterium]|nr:5-(carboxyamino)imidazole ribonucleotide mutase [Chitinophagales bacterium]